MACDPQSLPGARRIEGARHVANLRTIPANPPINRAFAIEVTLCARDGRVPATPAITAWMPTHRHGMNYRPRVHELEPGHARAEGFLLHMAGRWEFTIEIDGERLAAAWDVQ